MEISQETLLGLASFVDDIKAELDRIQKEKEEEQDDVVMRRMFGGAVDDKSGVLEEKRSQAEGE